MCRYFLMLLNFSAILIFLTPQIRADDQNKQPISAVNRPLGQNLGDRLAAMIKENHVKAAENLLKSSLKNPKMGPQIIQFHLAKLARRQGHSREWRTYLNAVASSPLTKNTRLMGEIYRTSPNSDQKWLSGRLADWGFFEPPLASTCPFFELNQRKNRGELLHDILRSGSLAKKDVTKKIWSELFVALPEAVDEKKYNNQPEFLAWQKSLKATDYINRMNNLMLFGKNLEARQTFQDANRLLPDMSPAEKCELNYENAKIDRKLRRYPQARAQFKDLAANCQGEVVIKARYMDLMLASMAGDVASIDQFDLFVADYPTHGFSDDVLLFKANVYLDKLDYAQVLAVLGKLEQQFPAGDMIQRALFLKAFVLARQGKSEQALLALKTLKLKSSPDALESAQADYWIARLLLFPELSVLKKPRTKNVTTAQPLLQGLISSTYPSVYSWLALQLMRELGLKPHLPIKPKTDTEHNKPGSQAKNLKFINLLAEHGFAQEALALLDEEPTGNSEVLDLATMAQSYIQLGRPELGHQKLVKCDEIQAQKLRHQWPGLFDQVSLPKPYMDEIRQVAQQLDVSPMVILAVMRQESGFLPEARSWAQARGLMQLIDSTAKEQASRLSVKYLGPDDLFRPELNLLLGTSALFRYGKRFGHLVVALSAYNAGPVAARKWLKENADGPIDTYIESIPFKETRAYVKNVLGGAFSYGVMENPHQLPGLNMVLGSAVP